MDSVRRTLSSRTLHAKSPSRAASPPSRSAAAASPPSRAAAAASPHSDAALGKAAAAAGIAASGAPGASGASGASGAAGAGAGSGVGTSAGAGDMAAAAAAAAAAAILVGEVARRSAMRVRRREGGANGSPASTAPSSAGSSGLRAETYGASRPR